MQAAGKALDNALEAAQSRFGFQPQFVAGH